MTKVDLLQEEDGVNINQRWSIESVVESICFSQRKNNGSFLHISELCQQIVEEDFVQLS